MIMNSDQYVVHVIDDDTEHRERIRRELAMAGFRTRTYESGEDFLEHGEPEAGCAVLDMRLPGIDGRDVRRAIAERGLAIKVVVATAFANVSLARDAFHDGAVDVLEKPLEGPSLLEAVRRAIDLLIEESTRHERSSQAQDLLGRLTPRQLEVLELLVEGYISKQIALKLGCSVRTIEAHRAQVMHRLGANSLAEVTRVYLDAASTCPPIQAPHPSLAHQLDQGS